MCFVAGCRTRMLNSRFEVNNASSADFKQDKLRSDNVTFLIDCKWHNDTSQWSQNRRNIGGHEKLLKYTSQQKSASANGFYQMWKYRILYIDGTHNLTQLWKASLTDKGRNTFHVNNKCCRRINGNIDHTKLSGNEHIYMQARFSGKKKFKMQFYTWTACLFIGGTIYLILPKPRAKFHRLRSREIRSRMSAMTNETSGGHVE